MIGDVAFEAQMTCTRGVLELFHILNDEVRGEPLPVVMGENLF